MCQLWQFVKNVAYLMTLRRRRATDCKFQVPDHPQTRRDKLYNTMSQARRIHARHRATDCKS